MPDWEAASRLVGPIGGGGLTYHLRENDRNVALDSVRVTEAAALAGARLMGRGDERAVDQAAADAMRQALNALDIDGTVVIGEGEIDQAPLLYTGERVGSGRGAKLDIALDPLEGTTIAARGGANAISCVAMAPAGDILKAPAVYMEKIAAGPGLPPGLLRLDAPPAENLARLAEARGLPVDELVVLILDRPRHDRLIAAVREAGARVRLIGDGDVAGAVATARAGTGIDVYMGIGGAHEGVLAAAALACIGGQFEGRLVARNEEERARVRHAGIADLDRVYGLRDLVGDDVTFTATGVTDGTMLKGVRRVGDRLFTSSIMMRARTGTVRMIEAEHDIPVKSGVVPHFQG